jgi:hypothetical protein
MYDCESDIRVRVGPSLFLRAGDALVAVLERNLRRKPGSKKKKKRCLDEMLTVMS